MKTTNLLSRTLLPFLATLAWPAVAWPCAGAPPRGESVRTLEEEALIVWDAAHHIEHFVREATFDSTAKSFGFLVPTPALPTLAEVPESVFRGLEQRTVPDVEYDDEWEPELVGCTALLFEPFLPIRSGAPVPAAAVRVLSEQRVAGMDATVLAASDAPALAEWLGGHGFAMRDALQRWLAVYVAKGWHVVAFRFERPAVADNGPGVYAPIQSRAVRITFPADAPVYPYFEPDDAPEVRDRRLRLFVAADRRLDGTLPDGPSAPWRADLRFAAAVRGESVFPDRIPGVDLPSPLWLHEFIDPATKRAPSDLVFGSSSSTREVHPPPLRRWRARTYPFPYEVPFVLAGAFLWWRRRRRRAQRHATP